MINTSDLYPLRFEPLYKPVMWGGDQMSSVLGRKLPESSDPIGESWEIVDRDDAQSVVADGPMKGRTLQELIHECGTLLLGGNFRGAKRFPLLVKLIDAGQRLSLQVHPDAEACRRIGNGAEPKTEMWYIISAKPNAKIMAGLNPRTTRQQLLASIDSPDVESHLQVFKSEPGDAYFIFSGTIHAIGEGNLLLEIQQNSDTTYRVSDWGRLDKDGKSRELHLKQAIESIDFGNRTAPRITGVTGHAAHNRKFPVINRCPFFKADDLRLVTDWQDTTDPGASFHLISAINGTVDVGRGDRTTRLNAGETCLIPAGFGTYTVRPTEAKEITILKTTA
jgi:mannose-6-phosphate isomerase